MQDAAAIGAKWGLTGEQVLSYIGKLPGYTPTFRGVRVEMVDVSNARASGIVSLADVSKYTTQSPTISHDLTQGIHRTVTLNYAENTAVDLNTLRHQLRIWMQWLTPQGGVLFEVAMGVFTTLLPKRVLSGALSESRPELTGNVWNLQMTDMLARLARPVFLDTYAIVEGSDPIAALVTMFQQAALPVRLGGTGQTPAGGMFAGPAWPGAIATTPTAVRLAADMQANPGDSVLAFAQSVCQSIGYYDPWVDVDDALTLHLDPRPDPRGVNPGFSRIYTTDETSVIVPGSINQDLARNISGVGNIARVLSNSGDVPIVSTQVNNSPNSAISLANNPDLALPIVIEDDTIPDQATADLRAFIALQLAAALAEPLDWQMAMDPLWVGAEHIGLNVVDRKGNVSVAPGLYPLEASTYSWDIANDVMSVSAGKLVAI